MLGSPGPRGVKRPCRCTSLPRLQYCARDLHRGICPGVGGAYRTIMAASSRFTSHDPNALQHDRYLFEIEPGKLAAFDWARSRSRQLFSTADSGRATSHSSDAPCGLAAHRKVTTCHWDWQASRMIPLRQGPTSHPHAIHAIAASGSSRFLRRSDGWVSSSPAAHGSPAPSVTTDPQDPHHHRPQ